MGGETRRAALGTPGTPPHPPRSPPSLTWSRHSSYTGEALHLIGARAVSVPKSVWRAEKVNLGPGRPRHCHKSGNSDPERARLPSLPTATRLPSGLRCLRRTGADTCETGKAAKELARSHFPIGDCAPFPAKRPPPACSGFARPSVAASRCPGPGAAPPELPEIAAVYFGGTGRPPPEFVLHPNFLFLRQPECPLARWPAPSPRGEENGRYEVRIARLRPSREAASPAPRMRPRICLPARILFLSTVGVLSIAHCPLLGSL